MGLTLLHTGDWHIGKPFGGLPDELAPKLRGARLDAIDRIADAARAGGASCVLVGGDTFDRPSLADRELRAPVALMEAHADLVWHIIPGNHDPAVAGGAWARMQRDGLPANVRLHLEPCPVALTDEAWLLPAPLAAKAMSHDPTRWMDDAETPGGALRIGLAHGSVQGFGSDRSASIEIAPDRPKRARLDYLALGDWHGARRVGPRAWYAGTPEPDGYLDNAPGHALLVRIDAAGVPPEVKAVEIGKYRWLRRTLDAGRRSDLAELEGEIAGMGARALQVLLAVEVAGRVSLEQDREIRARLDRLDGRLFHLEAKLERLVLGLDEEDLGLLGGGVVQQIGAELAAVAGEPGHPEREIAARALRRLFEMSSRSSADGAGARS